jgi:glycosyltransferase involved in cell wall biosynthesis
MAQKTLDGADALPTISLCMIVKNEEAWLGQCLTSVKDLVDEIVIVDTGSADKTKEIAKKFNANVFDFVWFDDFAAARNFSISKAKGDWILWLDADEALAKKDHEYIRKIVKEAQFPLATLEQRHYTNDTKNPQYRPVDERYEEESKGFKGYYPTLMMRLFKNNIGLEFEGKVHETLDKSMQKLGLKFLRTDIPVHHYQNFKSDIMTKAKRQKYETLLQEKEKDDPKNLKTLHDLAVTHLKKNDLKAAFGYFRRIFDEDNQLMEPYLGMGIIWAKRGNYPRAIKFFLNALDIKTTRSIQLSIPPEEIRETLLYNLGLCFLKTGERTKAMQIFKDMLRLGTRFAPRIQEKLAEVGVKVNVEAS